jgi:hypothetical protein
MTAGLRAAAWMDGLSGKKNRVFFCFHLFWNTIGIEMIVLPRQARDGTNIERKDQKRASFSDLSRRDDAMHNLTGVSFRAKYAASIYTIFKIGDGMAQTPSEQWFAFSSEIGN